MRMDQIGRRIMVVGSSGSGKSTFARMLARRLDSTVIHIDQIYWKPNWTWRPMGECRALVAEAVQGEAWVFDGNNSSSFDLREERADTVIFLDLPRWQCLWRVVKRSMLLLGRTRKDMAPNCPEFPDVCFWINRVWRFQAEARPKIDALIDRQHGKMIVHLRSKKEVEAFLASFPAPPKGATPRPLHVFQPSY